MSRDYAQIRSHLLWDLEPWLSAEPHFVSDMSVKQAYARNLADSFYKKLCPNGNSTDADIAALKKFKSINDRIPSTPFEFSANNEAESCFWDYFINNFNRCVGFDVGDRNFDLEFIRESMRTGPGAAQKANADTMVTKLFEGDITYCTSDQLIPWYRSALAETGLWSEAEMLRSSKFRFLRVEGGKLFFAPKNAEISRTCCTEANLNMLFQMSLGAFFEYRLEKHFGISLSTQPDFNRELARVGSIQESFGTIDKVSASDSMSWQLILRILEDGFTKAVLSRSRSETAVLPDGSKVVLNMISTMGNGFTFPLQTIIFASAVRACYQVMGFPCHCPKTQYGVFGDDIIVRREVYGFYCRMITKLGFEVNVAKSFNTGPFRESCGHDYFRGHNVRGVYVRSLELPQQIYSCINRLVRWSTDSGIPLTRTINFLRGQVRKVLVPPSEADDAGFKVPFICTRPSVDNQYWYSYRYYQKVKRKLLVPEADDTPNPFGTGVGFLSGHIRRRDLSITEDSTQDPSLRVLDWAVNLSLRDRPGVKSRYKIRRTSIPYWDWPGLANSGYWFQDELGVFDLGGDARYSVNQDLWKKTLMATCSF